MRIDWTPSRAPGTRALALAAVLCATLAAAPGGAQILPSHEVKPLVLLLLDTSGSMEYDADQPGVELGDVDDYLTPPTCLGVGNSGKSRWIVAQEVLTGSFADYSCTLEDRSSNGTAPCPREDCPYPVPHVVPHGTQALDGLIDRNTEDFKFGVMTFDTRASPNRSAPGGYSYGDETGQNYGARNETAPTGGFVKPSPSDDPADIAARNQLVQDSIRSAIPFGGTPIAPLLYDAKYFFETDTEVLADRYIACRPRSVVLITDGRANLGEGESPYQDSVRQAQALRDMGIQVYVIGFKLADGVSSLAEAIATNNGALDLPYYRADNSVDLVRAFTQILGNLSVATQSRTKTVVTSETGNPVDVQYQFNAAHAKVRDASGLGFVPGLRQGILERSVYQCGINASKPNESGLASIQRISDLLNAMLDVSRLDVWTVVNGQRQRFQKTTEESLLTPVALGVPAEGRPIPDFRRDEATGLCRSGFLNEGSRAANVTTWRNALIDYVRASDDSCRRGYKMGAMDHGTPLVQGRLSDVDLSIPSFENFKTRIASRDVMLYAPAHDGQLHAFKVDRPNGRVEDQDWGTERWAFIPPHTLPALQNLPDGRKTVLDGTPVIRDVVFSRSLSGITTETGEDWHSVLLVGDREGGRGLVALDVTDNSADGFQFLWDVSAEGGRCLAGQPTCNPGGAALFANDYSRLGTTYGKPEMGVVQVCPGNATTCTQGALEEVAVAVLPGGSSTGLPAGSGRTVVVIRIDTGEKLAEFRSGGTNVDSSCVGAGNVIDADMVGNVTCYSTFPGTFMSRCFLGDQAGRLWRLEIGSPGIPNWNLTLFYDPYASWSPVPPPDSPLRAPAYEAPSLAPQIGTNRLVVVYGTGDMDHLDQPVRKAVVVSLTESVEDYPLASPPDRTCDPFGDSVCRKVYASLGRQVGPTVNWKKYLGYDQDGVLENGALAGERMMGQAVLYGGTAYFLTFTPDPDHPCSAGIGRIYGVTFDRHDQDCQDWVGRMTDPTNVLNLVPSVRLGSTSSGAIPYGLAVVTRPACNAGGSIASGPPTGANAVPFSSVNAPPTQLVVQTGVAAESPSELPAQGSTTRAIHQATRTIRKAMESIYVSSWGNLMD